MRASAKVGRDTIADISGDRAMRKHGCLAFDLAAGAVLAWLAATASVGFRGLFSWNAISAIGTSSAAGVGLAYGGGKKEIIINVTPQRQR